MARNPSPFVFAAGLPWLDLVNTRPMRKGRVVDLLATPADVRAWLAAAAETHRMGRPAKGTRSGDALYREALKLRERLAVLARRAATGQTLARGGLDASLDAMPGSMRLVAAKDGGTALTFVPDSKSPGAALFPVIRSAAEWLAAGGRPAIKTCAAPHCVLFFADTTKNQARRWCSEASCGNRSRVSAFRERRRARPRPARAARARERGRHTR